MTEKPKFNIGDQVFYVRSSCQYGIKEPCRVCFGKRKVTVILGNGEQVGSECGYCAQGIDPPSGESMTWGADARIHSGAITGLRSDYNQWKYEVEGYSLGESEIFTTREEATPVMEARLKEETARRDAYRRDHFVTATKKQIWNVGYHRDRILDCERTADWHRMRLCMIEEKKQKRSEVAAS